MKGHVKVRIFAAVSILAGAGIGAQLSSQALAGGPDCNDFKCSGDQCNYTSWIWGCVSGHLNEGGNCDPSLSSGQPCCTGWGCDDELLIEQ
jgi:hypothetical protein